MSDNIKTDLLLFKKYMDLIKRSFKTKLDIYLFTQLIQAGNLKSISKAEFLHFGITDLIANKYEEAWQRTVDMYINGIKVKEIDEQIINWKKDNLSLKNDLFDGYTDQFKVTFSMNDFKIFYRENDEERVCSYCGISDKQLAELRDNNQLFTKSHRGKKMEIDRKNSNMEYMKSNIVLACYYCNNAKTDEFTPDEFKGIAEGIRQVWEKRLEKVNRV